MRAREAIRQIKHQLHPDGWDPDKAPLEVAATAAIRGLSRQGIVLDRVSVGGSGQGIGLTTTSGVEFDVWAHQ